MKRAKKIEVLVLVAFIPFLIFTHVGDAKADSFVGFSSATATGGSGIMELNRLCQISFSGSHMCTTEELMNSVNKGNKTPSASAAWIKPFMILFHPPSDAVDITGFEGGPHQLSCKGWSEGDGHTGLAIDATGKFSIRPCGDSLNVTCCGGKIKPFSDEE